ncbi:glucose-1-phosphate cytidylyltransferase [Pedobacter sp. WC2423]|uniref:glucose-1-phosphate cytidylyltransferase n=1 Tax=Pedobacter sp. WC2423 TaxID=3234142 RepID=UPI003467A8CF
MKVVILAGGLGTRLSEETGIKPKPMVEIGGMPILWHIMKIYSAYGYNDFIICLGYKGYIVKEYFTNYFLHKSDLTIDLKSNSFEIHKSEAESWKITLVNTGDDSMTGGRIKRIQKYVKDETFMLTYGDGVGDINIKSLVDYHLNHGKLVTVTSIQPLGRFGALAVSGDNEVFSFLEKPKGDGSWINGGYMVCQPGIFNFINNGDDTIWEREPMQNIASSGEMYAYKHHGFWRPMDTLKDKHELNEMWNKGNSPWKIW